MTLESFAALATFFALSFAAALTGALFRPGAWYEALRKPGWTPPNWAFPVVWSVLYVLIAIAGFLVWEAGGLAAAPALAVYGGQLVLNALWSVLFFGLRRIDWALYEVVVFWASIVATVLAFAAWSQTAALMLLPYLAWVSVAALLNLRIYLLNGPRGAAAQG